jgi:hypothetical protein
MAGDDRVNNTMCCVCACRQIEYFKQSRTNLINNDRPGFDFYVQ